VNLEVILLGKLVVHQEGGDVLALVALQLDDLAALGVLDGATIATVLLL
jgi:hypothetical protein